MSTVNYEPPRGTVSVWGDNYGNRVDRFLAGTAYLDGAAPEPDHGPRLLHPQRSSSAWDFRNGTLTRRWTFDSQQRRQQHVRRAGQPPAVRRRRRRRRPRRDRLRRDGHRRQRRRAVEHRQRPRRRPARRRPRSRAGPAWRSSRSTRTRSKPGVLDGRRPHRPDPLEHAAAAATTAAASPTTSTPAAPAPSPGRPAVDGLRNTTGAEHRPQARLGATSSSGGTATRCASCSTAPTSTSTAPAATPAC